MALTYRRLPLVLLSAAICFLAATPTSAVLENKTGQVTVFWGRHKDEGSLREACDTGMYTAVIMSFLNVDAAHGRYDLDLSGHPLTGIGDDIKHCQHVGVPVSLSIFIVGNNSSLPTNTQSALRLVDYLWNAYLGGGKRKGVHRPFGDARLDGIDFFVNHGNMVAQNYDLVAGELSKHKVTGKIGKPLQLTATPRCDFPRSLAAGIFERIHVRGYGDEADVSCDGWWDYWTSAYPSSRIFMDLAASPEAAKVGYVYPKSLYYDFLPEVQMSANYGGVMLWDRFYDKTSNYSSYVKRWA